MFVIYNKKTGIPRVNLDSETLLEDNLDEGEAWIKIKPSEQVDGDFKVVNGRPVATPPPLDDPVQISRKLRTELLKESDWTQYIDSPLTAVEKAQWANYRQKLRDFPAIIKSKFNIADEKFYFEVMSFLPEKPDS